MPEATGSMPTGAVVPGTSSTEPTIAVTEIVPAHFVAAIDNPYFPLTPGTQYVYEGTTDEGLERLETEVTSDTREVMGVECIVVHDVAYLDGKVVEDTFDWYAQDTDGNVWYFGEDTRTMQDGAVTSTEGSWEAGVDGARPGIIMKAQPRVGDSYQQEYYAGVAEDMAEVLSLTEAATVPAGAYKDLLMTKEWSPLEPGIAEHKYYAQGVGLIIETTVQGGSGRIELVKLEEIR